MRKTKSAGRPALTLEPPLPENLQPEWADMEKLVRETDQQQRATLFQVLDAINWVLIEANSLDEARLFVAHAARLDQWGRT